MCSTHIPPSLCLVSLSLFTLCLPLTTHEQVRFMVNFNFCQLSCLSLRPRCCHEIAFCYTTTATTTTGSTTRLTTTTTASRATRVKHCTISHDLLFFNVLRLGELLKPFASHLRSAASAILSHLLTDGLGVTRTKL